MKRTFAIALALLILLGMCAGCGGESSSSYYVRIGDTEFKTMPKRVITMSAALTETVSSLGFANRLVGVCDGVTAPTLASKLPACGTTLVPDTDTILSLAPDVLFTPVRLPAAATESLNAAGCSIVILPYSDTLEGIYTNWQAAALVLGGNEWGERIDEQLRYAAQVIKSDLAENVTAGESAAFIMRLPDTTATGGTYLEELLGQVGLTNAASDGTDWVYPADGKTADADIIFCDDDITLEDLQGSVWQNSAAVTGGRVVFLDGSALEEQSPRLLFVLQSAVREAYPDVDWQTLDITPEMEIPEKEEKGFFEKLFG